MKPLANWDFLWVAKSRVFYVILANHKALLTLNHSRQFSLEWESRDFPVNKFLRNEKTRAWMKKNSWTTCWIQLVSRKE